MMEEAVAAMPPRFAHGAARGAARGNMRRLAINLATSTAGYVKVGSWAATDTAVTLSKTVLFPGGTNEAPDDEPPSDNAANVGGAVGGAQPTASQLAMAGYYALNHTTEARNPDPGCHGVVMLARLCQHIFRLPARPHMCAPVWM